MGYSVLTPSKKEHSAAGWRSRLRKIRYHGRRVDWVAYIFAGPYLLIFVFLKIIPILFGTYVSFTDWGIVKAPHWIGLENYHRLLTDDWVVQVWGNTFKMAVLIVPGTVVVAMLFALYVNQKWLFSGLVRTLVFAPKTVAITVTALIWVWILEKETGVLNVVLFNFGLPKTGWLTTSTWVIPSIAAVTIWWGAGYHMVILLAGLQDIPGELIDSARLDGANEWQIFWKIILPLLRPALIVVITLELIAAFRIFGQVQLMTNGGPGGRSATIVSYIYSTGFNRFELGYAAALSLLLFVTIMFFSWIRLKFFSDLDY